MLRRISFIVVIIFAVYPLKAEAESSLEGRVPYTRVWKVKAGDDPSFKYPDYDDSGWASISLPWRGSVETLSPSDGEENTYDGFIWLRGERSMPLAEANRLLYFIAGNLSGACEFYFNGVLVYKHGRFPPDYQYTASTPKQTLLTPELVTSGDPNVVCVRLFNEAG